MSSDNKAHLPTSKNILQINELSAVLLGNNIDWGVVCKLFTEMFDDLVTQVTSLYCVEISKFALCCLNADFEEYLEFPSDIYNLIDDALGLYLYPADFAPITPKKLLEKTQEISKKYKISYPYKTRKEQIIEMYSDGISVADIALKLMISEDLVKKTLILNGYKIEGLSNKPALQWHSLWSLDICKE